MLLMSRMNPSYMCCSHVSSPASLPVPSLPPDNAPWPWQISCPAWGCPWTWLQHSALVLSLRDGAHQRGHSLPCTCLWLLLPWPVRSSCFQIKLHIIGSSNLRLHPTADIIMASKYFTDTGQSADSYKIAHRTVVLHGFSIPVCWVTFSK